MIQVQFWHFWDEVNFQSSVFGHVGTTVYFSAASVVAKWQLLSNWASAGPLHGGLMHTGTYEMFSVARWGIDGSR